MEMLTQTDKQMIEERNFTDRKATTSKLYTWCIECSTQAVKGEANLEVQRDQETATNDHQWKSNLSIAHSCFQIFFLEFFPNTQESTFITGIKQNA